MSTHPPEATTDRRQLLRGGLALLRLILVIALLCTLLFYAGLQWRAGLEAGWGLTGPAADAPVLSPAGVNIALESIPPAARDAALVRLTEHQIDWVRQRLDWGRMEPEPGHFDWTTSDAIIDAITGHGLEAVIVLDGSPAWARAGIDRGANDNPLAPPADPANFARFATAFADRYGDRVRYYQLWDEPNITPHWGARHIEPADYAQLLKAGATAIRTADPDAVIIAAALAPTQDRGHMAMDERYFLQRLYAAGAKTYMDVVAIEPLGFGYAPEMEAQRRNILNFRRAAWVRRTMQAAGDSATPLWAVRYGWNRDVHSPWGTVTVEDQHRYTAGALTVAARWPWLTGMAWAIDQPAAALNDPAWGFALDDELLAIIGNQTRTHPSPMQLRTNRNPALPIRLALLAVVALLLTWRGWRAARLMAGQLPLSTWLSRYRHAPTVLHIALWTMLFTAYYLATWPPFILLCLLVGALLTVAQPQIGLGLALLLLPFHFQHKELQLVNRVILIPPAQAALLALIPALICRGQQRLATHSGWRSWLNTRPLLDWLALAWLGVNLAAAWNVWHWPAYWRGFIDLALMPVLLYAAVRLLITDAPGKRGAAAALYAGGVLAAAIGLATWTQGGGIAVDGVRRLVGPHFSPNHTALYLERTFFLGIGLLLAYNSTKNRLGWRWAAIGISLLAVTSALLLTASRGAWLLGIPAGGAVFIWLALRQRSTIVRKRNGESRPIWRWLIGIMMVILAAVALLTIAPVWERLGNSTTLWRRFAIWQTTIDLWRAFPLTGVGPGGFFWRYPAFIPMNSQLDPNLRHPHNIWLEMVSIWGAIGLLWLLAALLVIGRGVGEANDATEIKAGGGWIRIGLFAALAASILHAQVDAFTVLGDVAGWNWAAVGLIYTFTKRTRSEAQT